MQNYMTNLEFDGSCVSIVEVQSQLAKALRERMKSFNAIDISDPRKVRPQYHRPSPMLIIPDNKITYANRIFDSSGITLINESTSSVPFFYFHTEKEIYHRELLAKPASTFISLWADEFIGNFDARVVKLFPTEMNTIIYYSIASDLIIEANRHSPRFKIFFDPFIAAYQN